VDQQRVLVLNAADNVAVALAPLLAGETIPVECSSVMTSLTVRMPIPSGHKVALCALSTGDTALKYGQPIGRVTHPIAAGEHVHVHNLVSTRAG